MTREQPAVKIFLVDQWPAKQLPILVYSFRPVVRQFVIIVNLHCYRFNAIVCRYKRYKNSECSRRAKLNGFRVSITGIAILESLENNVNDRWDTGVWNYSNDSLFKRLDETTVTRSSVRVLDDYHLVRSNKFLDEFRRSLLELFVLFF